ncbi:CDP-diacylglycerol--serine O-phosphatidyltransferase [Oleiphilus sp. HI0071]|uniref:CDP-diacylglycerol--serine O-phosphatidyltransferase n=1 Tax=Oleiphilus sp. HI0080 TaxID=1822255 RepID=UPI0007C244C0|nr:CDP-diacylglycerol--serine O-phosphatidyltransferase [Oleiphilus sp. HI0080]KZY60818.1 CDP-diacylglycerol--serine O-phosphatidyltransferase [Oleiphilus sp. HI0065]KZY79290.1 CDP-diacylglycerol--serine O-phosphatidyltransferase [Oleiphilus sp. HI0071]KZY92483.1 CDP-diacylglycerol--serine O-phosphatidyltransferase [Oleiphilus sp. HI0073]KZZ51146.1 CDP-diacylglycerol--serine O-phosphatidyltransferase [Oleiphilus sp. HI0122]KZZ80351.1 CDP-diacylglycerol--serine O-phosphatidyltransferase [Oleiph
MSDELDKKKSVKPEVENSSFVETGLNASEDHDDAEKVEKVKKRGRGIYLLPNLFTTASLFSGFYAIVAAMNGHFENAAIAIFVSMILDGLDGRVARMTNTQSAFGAEYDSLVDMVAFGVAPALVAFSLNLQTLGKIGWVATFIYVAGAALRLARFNTQIGSVDKRYFVGLPSPAAAALVAGFVWVFHSFEQTMFLTLVTMLFVASAGVLMVSNVLYNSFKEFDLKARVPFTAVLVMVLVFAVIALEPSFVLLLGFVVYAASGPVTSLLRRVRSK